MKYIKIDTATQTALWSLPGSLLLVGLIIEAAERGHGWTVLLAGALLIAHGALFFWDWYREFMR